MKKAIRILLAVLLVAVIVVTFAACSEQDPCQANGHKWDEGTYTLAPTCKDVGKAIFRCKVCGEEEEREVPKTEEHKWGEGVITTEPTCATPGVRTYTCSVCQTTKTEIVDPTGKHTKGEAVAQVDATCHSKGTKAYWLCEDCGAKLNEAGVVVTDADLEIDMLAHVWDNGTITKDPTCTEPGTKLFKCTNPGCIETFEQELKTTDHVFGRKVEKVDPTCTTDGHLAYYQCEECKQYFTEQKAPTTWDDLFQEKLGHQVRTLEKVDPTCQNTGLTEGTVCDRCGETLKAQQPLDKLPHTPVPYGDKAATCEAKGYQGGQQCSVCHTVLVQPKEVPATGHAYVIDETKGDKGWLWSDDFGEATLYLKCNNANCPKPDVSVKADVSSYKPDADHTEYTAVARYDDQVYRTTLTVNKNHENHVYVVVEWKWVGYECESVTLRCTVGNEQKTVAATVEVEHTVVPDCTHGGKNTYTATAEHEGVTYTDKKVEELGKTAHQPKADLEHDDNGHGHKCEVCGDYVDYTEHTFKDEHNTTHHWEECTEPECGYKKNEVEHTLTYEHVGAASSKQHKGTCQCGYTVTEACTLDGDNFCSKCKTKFDDGKEDLIVHFHMPTTWNDNNLKLYVFIKNGDSSINGGYPGTKGWVKDTVNDGWYTYTIRVARGHINKDLYVIPNDKASTYENKTGDVLVIANEVWIPSTAGEKSYTSMAEALNAENTAPTESDYFITGSFQGTSVFTKTVGDWKRVFTEKNSWTLESDYKKGDTFRIRQNFDDWNGDTNYGYSKMTITGGASGVNYSGLLIAGADSDNIQVTRTCHLKITFNPADKQVKIYVVSADKPSSTGKNYILAGVVNGISDWSNNSTKYPLTYNSDGTYSITVTFKQFDSFKIWEKGTYNALVDGGCKFTYTFADGLQKVSDLFTGSSGGNVNVSYDCTVTFKVISTNNVSVTVTALTVKEKVIDYYIRGGMNNWLNGADDAFAPQDKYKFTKNDDGTYTLSNLYVSSILQGNNEFKIYASDNTWYGGTNSDNPITVKADSGITVTVNYTDNLKISPVGYYDFTWNPTTKQLTVAKHVEAHTHNYELTGWQWNKDFTQATATFECKNTTGTCSAQKVEVKATGDAIKVVETVAATCQTTGVKKYSATVEDPDGKSHTTTETQYGVQTLDKLPHSYGAPVWGVWTEKDGAWTITVTFTCTTCTEGGGHVITPEVDVKHVETVATDCKKAGYVTWSASVTVGEETYNATDKVVDTAPLPHAAAENAPWQFDAEHSKHYKLCQWCETEPVEEAACAPLDASSYEHDKTSHWRLCGVCNNQINKEEHGENLHYTAHDNDQQHDVYCSKCDYRTTENCTPDGSETDWNYDADYHWHECTLCGSKCDKTVHEFSDTTKKCEVCGQEKSQITIRYKDVPDHNVDSISDAVQYVHDNHSTYPSTEQVEIILNDNRTGNGFDMKYDSNFLINLNGHSFTIETQSLNVVAGAKIEFKNGKIQGDDKLSKDVPMIVTSGDVTFTNVDLQRSYKDWTAVRIDGGTFTVTSDGTHKINGTLLYNDKTCQAVVTITGKNLNYNGKLAEGIECTDANITVNTVRLTHDFAQPTWAWDGYTKATATFVCNRCKHTDVLEANEENGGKITHSTTKEPTCEATGTETYTATVSHNDSEFTTAGIDLKTKTIPATGHEYTVTEWKWQEDYTYSAEKQPTLTVALKCDHKNCEHSEVTVAVGTQLEVEVKQGTYKAAECTTDGSVTFTATLTYDGLKKEQTTTNDKEYKIAQLGHSPVEGDFHEIEDGQHAQKCSRCGEYVINPAPHDILVWYTNVEEQTHYKECPTCHYKDTSTEGPCDIEKDNLISEECTECGHQYADEITIYLHQNSTVTWAANKIYLWAYIENGAKSLYDEYPGKLGLFTACQDSAMSGWVEAKITIARGHLDNDLYVVANLGENAAQTGNIQITAKTMYISKNLDFNKGYTTKSSATSAEKVTTSASTFFLTGCINGVNADTGFTSYTNEINRVFCSEKNYTIEGYFKSDDTFRVRNNLEGWGGTQYGFSNMKIIGHADEISTTGLFQLYTSGIDNGWDNNIQINKNCVLRITFKSDAASGEKIQIYVLAVGTTTHTHNLGKLVPETPGTCTDVGVLAHYRCSCGLYYNLARKVVELSTLQTSKNLDNHNWQKASDGKNPTCTEAGYKPYYKCEWCGKFAANNSPRADEIFQTEAEVQKAAGVALAALGHEYKLAEQSAWEWSGNVATLHLVCGKDVAHTLDITINRDEVYGGCYGTTQVTPATCTKAEVRHYIVTLTKEQFEALLAVEDETGKLSTDLEAAFTSGSITNENTTNLAPSDPATGHSYVPIDGDVWTWSESKEEATIHLQCSVCKKDTAEATFDAHKETVGSCTTASTVQFTVTVTEDTVKQALIKAGKSVKQVTIDANLLTATNETVGEIPGHDWQHEEEGYIVWEYTDFNSTITAKVSYKCSRCKATVVVTFKDIAGKHQNHTVEFNESYVFSLEENSISIRATAQTEGNAQLSGGAALTDYDSFEALNESETKYKVGEIVHDFTGQYRDVPGQESEKHEQKCTICDAYGNQQAHTLEWKSDGVTAGHHQECSVEGCNHKTDTTDHTWGETYTNSGSSSGGHHRDCPDCSQRDEQAHKLSYEWVSGETHRQVCSGCHYYTNPTSCVSYLNNDVCSLCHKDYRIAINVHFHTPDYWKATPHIWAWATVGVADKNVYADNNFGEMLSEGNNWYKLEIKYPRNSTNQKLILLDGNSWSSYDRSNDITLLGANVSEVWINKNFNVYNSKSTATSNEKYTYTFWLYAPSWKGSIYIHIFDCPDEFATGGWGNKKMTEANDGWWYYVQTSETKLSGKLDVIMASENGNGKRVTFEAAVGGYYTFSEIQYFDTENNVYTSWKETGATNAPVIPASVKISNDTSVQIATLPPQAIDKERYAA